MGKTSDITGIAIIADEEEWQALAEQNPLFEFKNYRSYLVDVERRMRSAARAGRQVLVGPLMPDQFETRADAAGLPRDSPRALKEYERFVAELGPLTRPWTGEPITQVLERLRRHVRAETLQTRAVPALSAAAELHDHPHEAAQQAMAQAAQVIMLIADAAGDGQHELRIHVAHPDGDLEYTLPYSRCAKVIAFPDDGGENMAVILLAIASLAERPGTMTLRSRPLPAFFPSRRKPKYREGLAPTRTDTAATADAASPADAATTTDVASAAAATMATAADAASGADAATTADVASAATTMATAADVASAAAATMPPAADVASAADATAHTDRSSADRDLSSDSDPNSNSDSYGSILRGWRLGGLRPQPMSEGQLFAYTCTTPGGDSTPHVYGTRFRAGFPLDRPQTHSPAEKTT